MEVRRWIEGKKGEYKKEGGGFGERRGVGGRVKGGKAE